MLITLFRSEDHLIYATYIKAVVMHEIYANIVIRTVKLNAYTIWWIRASIVNNLVQVSVNSDITKIANYCTTYNLFKLNL